MTDIVEVDVAALEIVEVAADLVVIDIATHEVIETIAELEVVELPAATVVIEAPTLEYVEVGIQGPPGIPGTAGAGSATALPFSWGDANPRLVVTVLPGKKVLKVEVLIDTPFDIASVVTLGDTGDHSRLLGITDIDTTASGTYQTNPGYKYTVATAVNLYISPATGVTAGNGLILIYLEA